jgi:hypothetical protein
MRFEAKNELNGLPSGKHTHNSHNYGKSPYSMGKSTINWICSIAMLVYHRVSERDGETHQIL